MAFITMGDTPNDVHSGSKCIPSSFFSKNGWSCVVE